MAGIFSVISKLFGNKYEKDIKKIKPTLDLIHAEHQRISSLSNDELREQTQILKNQINEFVDPINIRFLNRLSDYLFVLSRYNLFINKIDEVIWQKKS